MGLLAEECKKLRSSSANYQEIRNFPIGRNSGSNERVDSEEFKKKAESVAIRLKEAFYTKEK